MRLLVSFLLFLFLSCVTAVKAPENFLPINEELFSGGAPKTAANFAYLKSVGVKSLISVDGAEPNIELAKSYGLEYLHVPYSYGEISRKDQAKLLKSFKSLSGPVYIHCHHGKHRAPAGAAVILKNFFSWSGKENLNLLKKAGTSEKYKGLYLTAEKSTLIPKEEWQKEKVTVKAKVSNLTREMAVIDRHWDRLKKASKLNWMNRFDLKSDIVVIRESLIELDRFNENHYMDYSSILDKAEKLDKAILNSASLELTTIFKEMAVDCKSCHRKFRD